MRPGSVCRILKEKKKGHTMAKDSGDRGAKREARGQGRAEKQGRQQGRQARNSGKGQSGGKEADTQQGENRLRRLAGGGKSKDGCFPKLFVLLLPFIAVGTFFLLRS
jgi:hypothetical protein